MQAKKLCKQQLKNSLNDKDNTKFLKTYFQGIQQKSNDPSMLDELIQRPVTMSFDMEPSIEEGKVAVRNMKNNTAPGISGITTNMMKKLPEEGCEILTSHIQQFWEDFEYDHEAWHKMKLMLLYKGKGKLVDLNNLERNLLERDISKNLELDPCKEITTEPWKNESRSKSIQPCQLSGSSSYPSFHTNPQMPMWTQNLCPFHQSNQSL